MVGEERSGERQDRLHRHYEVVVATYRQQSDLYIKSFIAYLMVVGGAGAYYFSQDTTRPVRVPLLLFIVMTSVICLVGTVTGYVWVRDIERLMRTMEADFKPALPTLPLYGGRVLGGVATLGVLTILCAAIYLMVRS